MKGLIFILLLIIFNFAFCVEIIEEKEIVLVPEAEKVENLKEGYLILEYKGYQLVINAKNSKVEEKHLSCSKVSSVFLHICGEKLIKPKIINELRKYNKIARNIRVIKYVKFNNDKFGICTQFGIFFYKNGKLEPIVIAKHPSYIEDCDFSPDGKYAVYVKGKNSFETILNVMTFGRISKSSYSLMEVNTDTKKKKLLLKGYKFFTFYSPVYSIDGKTIYFQTDRVGNFKEKGLYAYDRTNGVLKYEIFIPYGNPFRLPDGNLLLCYLKNIYIYDVKKKELSHIFTLDRDCPINIYYSKEPVE